MTAALAHLSSAHLDLLERCERLAQDVFAPIARQGDAGRVNRPLVASLGEHELLARVLQKGRAVAALDLCLIREGLARHSTDAETAFALQCLGAHPLLTGAGPAVVDTWLPLISRGEAVAAFALTEPEGGSDVAALRTTAEQDSGGYRLSGEKAFISNAPDADVYTVFARTTADAGARGITCFAVPADAHGLSGRSTPLLSDHPIGSLVFDGVFVPADHVVGEVDKGFSIAMRTLDVFRPSVGAFGVGMAQAALDCAVAHAAGRQVFGRPLSAFQGITHQLADVATRLQAARLLVHAAASAHDASAAGATQLASMAKLYATETAAYAVDVAIQVHGARALERGHLLEHLYREVRGIRIYEGTSEIQREIIARELFATTPKPRRG